MPSLLSGVSTSWTPEGVAISVVTTKQVFCERADRLGITTTMSNSSGLFPSQTAAGRFADGTIVINDTGLSPGTYTCTIVVIDQSGPVEYQTTSCQVGVRNSKQLKITSHFYHSSIIATIDQRNVHVYTLAVLNHWTVPASGTEWWNGILYAKY